MKSRAVYISGGTKDIPVKITGDENTFTVTPDISDYSDIEYIDLMYDFADAAAGEDGYYVIPRAIEFCNEFPDDHLCFFTEREDSEKTGRDFLMTMFGMKKADTAWCASVTGYTYEYELVVGVKDGKYRMFPRFRLDGETPYEQISVKVFRLYGNDADYSGICRAYRKYALNERGCKPLSERMNPELEYACNSLYIRIRLAWKPVPSPVEEQTDENEPALHVAMTFAEVEKFMEKLHGAGVEKAEICLVGWNISGHDGRYPQMFPVEEKLGGEEGLKKAINKAHELGYQLVCHTNCTDSYSIANNFDMGFVRKNKDGSIARHPVVWSGGLARQICPSKAMELTRESLIRLKELGFRGLHYIDVLTTLPIPACYNPDHPVTRRQSVGYFGEAAHFAKELFGGFASEGGYDFIANELDFALYLSFYDSDKEQKLPLFDKRVPLWQLVYHGIILSNPYTETFNTPIKSRRHQLELIERGGRPTTYIFSKFTFSQGKRWEEIPDIRCSNEVQSDNTVKLLVRQYNEFKDMMYLQTEFMEHHREISDGVYEVVYSDNTVVNVDYNTGKYSISKKK